MFSSRIPRLFGSPQCRKKSQRFYYSCLSSGFHLLFTAVSQCFSTETWIFSQRCESVHVNVNEGTCVSVCVGEGNRATENFFQTHLRLHCMCVFKAGRGWVNYLKMLKKTKKNSENSPPASNFSIQTPQVQWSSMKSDPGAFRKLSFGEKKKKLC